MSLLNIFLVFLCLVFWGGMVAYFYRGTIYKWLDRRIAHEVVTERIRAAFSWGRAKNRTRARY